MKTETMFAGMIMVMMLAIPFAQAFDASANAQLVSETQIDLDPEAVKSMIPTEEAAEANIVDWNRFLLYTHEGVHIMWGKYGNGYFRAKDNNQKSAWGIYGINVFAGFYDGNFFYGKYRSNIWKAIGLFEEGRTHGKFVLFQNQPDPQPVCKDSDGGFNVRKAGKTQSCTLIDGQKICDEAKDYCIDNTHVLVEIYCAEDGSLAREKFECPFGCKNGACVKPRICPDVYEPVCGTLKLNSAQDIEFKHLKTYSNKCELVGAGAVFLYEGECKLPVLSVEIDAQTNASLKTKAAESQNEANAQANSNGEETELKTGLRSFLGLGN